MDWPTRTVGWLVRGMAVGALIALAGAGTGLARRLVAGNKAIAAALKEKRK